MFKEFKEFAMRGNVLDLAVAVVIGAAFGAIVTSLVNDVIMPPIGLMLGGVDFSELTLTLQEAHTSNGEEIAAVEIRYGIFVQRIIDFLIIAFAIFMVIKGFNRMNRKKEEAAAPAPEAPKGPTSEELLTEIRDLLRKS
ncbi:MAG: large-conductance mechanosensitive channel protein MscL [Saprospirales bacterium]|nr:MAG: large-conductance mechanosensitive channel protein MscL [Saprospirales bacterium]